jgi:hypothetical protein
MDCDLPYVKQLGEHIMMFHAGCQLQLGVHDSVMRIDIGHQPALEAQLEWASPQH